MANREEQWRREGMAYALRVAREKGIDGLAEELRFRNVTEFPIGFKRSEVNKLLHQSWDSLYQCFRVIYSATLQDLWDFTPEQIQQTNERAFLKEECIGDGFCTWLDYVVDLADSLGIRMDIKGLTDVEEQQ